MSREPVSREELLDSYRSPYLRRLPSALKGYGVHYLAGATVLLGAVGVIALEADAGLADTLLSLAAFGLAAAGFVAAWALAVGVRRIRVGTREWRPQREQDLARLREQRPHRGEADPGIAHVEYAVSTDGSGTFTTWAFEPLLAGDEWDEKTVLIPGVPRYEAHAVEHLVYAAPDEAHAREQLAESQDRAAAMEADEIVRARLELEHGAAAVSRSRAGAW